MSFSFRLLSSPFPHSLFLRFYYLLGGERSFKTAFDRSDIRVKYLYCKHPIVFAAVTHSFLEYLSDADMVQLHLSLGPALTSVAISKPDYCTMERAFEGAGVYLYSHTGFLWALCPWYRLHFSVPRPPDPHFLPRAGHFRASGIPLPPPSPPFGCLEWVQCTV